MQPRLRLLVQACASVVFLGTLVFLYRMSGRANHTTIALSFLLVVLFVAAKWGLAQSITASITAALFFNYFFLPPVGTWTIADPENWVALSAFLVTAIVASELSAKARARTEEAIERQKETERLYTLNRMILGSSGSPADVASQTAEYIAGIFQVPLVAIANKSGEMVWSEGSERRLDTESMKECTRTGQRIDVDGGLIVPLSLGDNLIGSLGIFGTSLPDAALHSVANLTAVALERVQTQELASRTEIVRRQEEFKSSLLDGLAHEFKTPLTALAAAASAVAYEEALPKAEQRELLEVVLEETGRLDRLVTETIKMAQIDAGKARLNREPLLLTSVAEQTVARLATVSDGREIQLEIPGDVCVDADRELIGLALKQFLDNAVKYSGPSTPVGVSARVEGDRVRICVWDQGPGIDETEQQYIFEKYYRAADSSKRVKGAGVGLSVARDIVTAHGGKTWVESVPGQGSRFYFTLRLARKEVAR